MDNLLVNQTHRYFFMTPNLIDDMGLSVYAFRLYSHILRVTGNGGNGTCWQSTQTLATHCKMSPGSVSSAKTELKNADLIKITEETNPNGGRKYHRVSIVDIWEKNAEHYKKDEQVHLVNFTSSPHELKKNHMKNSRSAQFGENSKEDFERSNVGAAPSYYCPPKKKNLKNDFFSSVEKHYRGLLRDCSRLIQNQDGGRRLNEDALIQAFAIWRGICAGAKNRDGDDYSVYNRDAILERYDEIVLRADPGGACL